MKVFISWSGSTSRALAEILKNWLPAVIQAVKPYYSADDITKGTRWNAEVAKELSDAKVGILCLTRDNLTAPWVLFEAGALSKNIDESRVVPLLFGLQPTDVQYPLATFQTAQFEKVEMKRVITMINSALGEQALAINVLDNVFDMWWPNLENQVNKQLRVAQQTQKARLSEVRSERDLLEEILAISRETAQSNQNPVRPGISSVVIHDLVEKFSQLVNSSIKAQVDSDVMTALWEIRLPIEYMVRRSISDQKDRREIRTLLTNTIDTLEEEMLQQKSISIETSTAELEDDEEIPF